MYDNVCVQLQTSLTERVHQPNANSVPLPLEIGCIDCA
jgi:hypothetical protein